MSLLERIESRIDKSDPDGCWPWTSWTCNGVPYINDDNGRQGSARRRLMELTHGPLERKYIVVPTCNNPICMRHLVATVMAKVYVRWDNPTATNALKMFCPKGHPLSGDNTYVAASGGRKCRACNRERTRAWRRTHPEAHLNAWCELTI
jgi:hypothetical protein